MAWANNRGAGRGGSLWRGQGQQRAKRAGHGKRAGSADDARRSLCHADDHDHGRTEHYHDHDGYHRE
jgi:hypothetical protein